MGKNYGEAYREELGFGKHGYPAQITWYRVFRSQLRVGHAHRLMAVLRNLVISLLRAIGFLNIASALRHFAARPHFLITPPAATLYNKQPVHTRGDHHPPCLTG